MNTIRSGVVGMLAAFAVVAMVMGALSLGLLEGSFTPETTPTPRQTLPPPNLTPIIGTNPTREIPSPVVIKPATPTLCPQPSGWEPYIVMVGDNLTTLAESRGYSLEQILIGNCLISEMIIPEKLIYLPPAIAQAPSSSAAKSSTPTLACQRPTGWTVYVVKRGDTLTRISVAYRVTISYLKQINCLLSDTILPGWTIWVPNVATSTFTASPTATEKPTETETPTWTVTITNTVTLTATVTPSRTSTATPTMTPTFTDSPTVTSTPTETTVLTATPTATQTPTDTPTATPEPTSPPTQP